jgi:hypothetical protein
MSQKMTRRIWLSTLVSSAFGGVLASRAGASSKPMSKPMSTGTTRYDFRGRPVFCRDEGFGRITTFTYDTTGQALTSIRPLVSYTTYSAGSLLRS